MKTNTRMCTFLLAFIPILILTVLTAGCKKSETTSSNNSPTTNAAFSCKVGGTNWSPTTPVVAEYISNMMTITATSIQGTTGETMTLLLINVTGPGTFNLASSVGTCYASFTRTAGTSSETFMTSATWTGTVQITSLNTSTKKIAGTFSFSAQSVTTTNTVSVTDGSFNVSYLP